jgi:hypothetical protein
MSEYQWKIQESEATDMYGEDFAFINVFPMYGTDHHLSPGCWCEPEESIINGRTILTHKSDH